ncbi:M20 aminoacylase family protein [Pantoea cypripedii]|uniref:Amidohydrolase n=1 Tax=Pantoea cypripedii TaxID=55209 RepID=A0A6B9G4E4_PANCY|nr:M20 aminoacylase family protein [Pantoea cypripedii]QGY31732.1 amidohydrolase [Pantoea cypripedii]
MGNISQELIRQAIDWRRELHRIPEIGLQELRTSERIAALLSEFGLEVHRGIAGTGIVAVLRNGPGPAIGLRADIDALPMQERTGCDWQSIHAGAMHACGHDGHSAILLGAACDLAQTRQFSGTVYFIFQPAEENAGGGRLMIEDGLFSRFPMQSVFALHNWPGLPLGECAISSAVMMASQDNFTITLQGKGCHAAMPELGADPIIAASQLVLALQTIAARRLSPLEQCVISVTQIHAGEAINVIPDRLTLSGTLRCLSTATRERCWQLIDDYARTVPQALGVAGNVEWTYGYPVTQNHASQADELRHAALATAGITRVHDNPRPSMAAEDFAYLLQACPGAYLWLGADGATPSASLHSPNYDFNDDLITPGIGLWVSLVERLLPSRFSDQEIHP